MPAILSDHKIQEVATAANGLLPGLWVKAGFPQEAIFSYRRALLGQWNLDRETAAKIRKEFAVFLLHGGTDAEEALHLLMTQLKLMVAKQISWDQSLLDHLTFALSISGGLPKLAEIFEGLPSSTMDSDHRSWVLALCYSDQSGDERVALDLLKKMKDPGSLLLASKICGNDPSRAEEGIFFGKRAAEIIGPEGDDPVKKKMGVAYLLMGISLSNQARSCSRSDVERGRKQREAMSSLEKAEALTGGQDPRVLRSLCLEHAEQRRLDSALKYAKKLLQVEAGSDPSNWVLTARILSGQKRLADAEAVVNAGIDQTEPSSQRHLLLTKARIQVAVGRTKDAIETYARLLSLLQMHGEKVHKSTLFGEFLMTRKSQGFSFPRQTQDAEMEVWVDLAKVYVGMSRWVDADFCLSKSRAIKAPSALFWHATGTSEQQSNTHLFFSEKN